MRTFFIKNIKALITLEEKDNLFENVNMLIEDGKSTTIDEEKIIFGGRKSVERLFAEI